MATDNETVISAVGVIEIPEPDYENDDIDDEHAAPDVPAVIDDVVTPEHCQGNEVTPVYSVPPLPPATPPLTQSGLDDCDVESTSYKFEQVRAKLEAYTRDELHVLAASLARDDSNPEIPDPDYSDSDSDPESSDVAQENGSPSKKVDVPQSKEQRELFRELLRNQKIGLNVLSKKSELELEMEKRKMRQQRREEEENQKQKRSSFEIRMEEQANKLILAEQQQQQQQQQQQEQQTSTSNSADQQEPEFVRVHSKISKVKSAS